MATCTALGGGGGSCCGALPSSSTSRLAPSSWLEGTMLMEATASSTVPCDVAAAASPPCRQLSTGAGVAAPGERGAGEPGGRGEADLPAEGGAGLEVSCREEGRSGARSSGDAGGTLPGEACGRVGRHVEGGCWMQV